MPAVMSGGANFGLVFDKKNCIIPTYFVSLLSVTLKLRDLFQLPKSNFTWRQIARWLWHSLRGNRLQATLNATIGLAGVALGLLSVWAMQRAIDIASGSREGSLYWAVALMSLLILGEFGVGISRVWIRNILGVRAQNRMQQQLVAHLLKAHWQGREAMHSGDIINRLEEDVRQVVNFLTETLPSVLSTLAMFIGAFVYLLGMDTWLACTTVGILPVFIAVSRIYVAHMRRYSRQVRQTDSQIQGLLTETMQHRMLVKTMEANDQMLERLDGAQQTLRDWVRRRTFFSVGSNLFLNIGFSLGYLIAFLWGALRLSAGTLTYGGMTAFLQLVYRIQGPARDIARLAPAFVSVFTAAERLMESQNTYTQRLAGTTWVMEYYPTTYDELLKGEGYLIMAQFKGDGSVRMGMKNSASSNRYVEDTSLWEIVSDQGPVLSFNSYNKVFHTFSDPGNTSNGLYQGEGYEGDYEFVVLSLPSDDAHEAMLKGKKRATYVRMTRLPDGTDFEQYLDAVSTFQKKYFPSTAPTCNYLTLGGKEYVATGANTGILSLYPKGGDAISETTEHFFLLTLDQGVAHLRFRDDVKLDSVATVRELVYDSIADNFIEVGGGEACLHGEDPLEAVLGMKATINRAAEMSENFSAKAAEVYTTLRRKQWTYSGVQFTQLDSVTIQANLRYQEKNRTYQRPFNFGYQRSDNKLTLTYQGPAAESTQTFINTYPITEELIKMFEGQYEVTPSTTAFNLTYIKFTSTTDANSWFVVTMSN